MTKIIAYITSDGYMYRCHCDINKLDAHNEFWKGHALGLIDEKYVD